MLRRDFGRKNLLNWSFQSVAPSRMISSAYRGSPPCAIFHHPDKKEILHSNVLTKKQVAEGKIEAEVTYNQTIAEERAKGEVIPS